MKTRPALLLLALAGCTSIPPSNEDACPCLGPRGHLEFSFPPGGQCTGTLSRTGSGLPDSILAQTCAPSSQGPVVRPYDLVGATITSTNENLLLATYDNSCGSNCVSLTWRNSISGTTDLVVTRNGAEIDRVTLTVTQ